MTYGEFISTPYSVGIDAGVDALLHMSRYELGVIPDELQRPLVDDPRAAGSHYGLRLRGASAAQRSALSQLRATSSLRIMQR